MSADTDSAEYLDISDHAVTEISSEREASVLMRSIAVAPPPFDPFHLRSVPRASSRECVHGHGAVRDDAGGAAVAEVSSVGGRSALASGV